MQENQRNGVTLSLSNPPPGTAYTNQAYVNSEYVSHTPTSPTPYPYSFQPNVAQSPGGIYPAIPDVGKNNTPEQVQTNAALPTTNYIQRNDDNLVKRSRRYRIIGAVICSLIVAAIIAFIVVVVVTSQPAKQTQGSSVEGGSKPTSEKIVKVVGQLVWTNPSSFFTTNEHRICKGVKVVYGKLYSSCETTHSAGTTFYFDVSVKSSMTQISVDEMLIKAIKTGKVGSLKVFDSMDIYSIDIAGSLSWRNPTMTTISTSTTRRPMPSRTTRPPMSFRTVSKALNCNFKKTSSAYNWLYGRIVVSDYGVCNYVIYYSAGSIGEYLWGTGRGSTGLSGTGPSKDPFGGSDGYYVYTDASKGSPGDWTQLLSSSVSLEDNSHCLNFWYHMYGDDIGRLSVILIHSDNSVEVLWNRTREQGNEWRKALVRLPQGSFKVAFKAYRGLRKQGEIAIDAISVTKGTCQEAAVCDANEFRCGTGECIAKDLKCDHVNNCPDKSDEAGCPLWCPTGKQACLNEDKCIMNDWVCDGYKDCNSGSDENGCNKCKATEFTCTNYECVQSSSRCDGVKKCQDGSDEKECGTSELSSNNNHYITQLNLRGSLYRMCSDRWSSYHSELFCSSNGLGMFEELSLYEASMSASYLQVSAQHNTALQTGAIITSSCPSGKIVGVKCRVPDFSCGARSSNLQFSSSYVFGGQDAQLGAWPWQVLILKKGHPSCGGTIINQNWILTAAHCVKDSSGGVEPSYKFRVVVGNRRRDGSDSTARTLDISSITQHENYMSTNTIMTNDVALLKLRIPLSYNDYIRPVCLPEHQQTFPLSSLCYVSGYGLTDELATRATYQQEAKTQLVSTSKCSAYYNAFTIDTKQFCAGYDSVLIDTCSGDSGGPLVCLDQRNRWVQVGVTSWGYSTCGTSKYGVYANINQFTSWIKQRTGI